MKQVWSLLDMDVHQLLPAATMKEMMLLKLLFSISMEEEKKPNRLWFIDKHFITTAKTYQTFEDSPFVFLGSGV